MPCAYCESKGQTADHDDCHKLCTYCPNYGRSSWQPVEQFSPSNRASKRLRAVCRQCNAVASLGSKARRRDRLEEQAIGDQMRLPPPLNPVVESPHVPSVIHQRAPQLAKEDYDTLFQAQGGKCAACDRPEWLIVRGRKADLRLYVWGAIGERLNKALICRRCDSMIEEADDDPGVVARLLGFMTQNPSVQRQGRLHMAQTNGDEDS